MALRIEDYALIGDCETAALVGCNGSVNWLCWPRFDSEACFAALPGGSEHGRWLIAPADPSARVARRYRPDTLILETAFEPTSEAVTLIDFMPPRGRAPASCAWSWAGAAASPCGPSSCCGSATASRCRG